MADQEGPMLRARPYYEPEQRMLGVELLCNGEVFALVGLGEATAFGAELIRMAAYAENEAQLDLSYEMLGNDLTKRKLLLAMHQTARKVYFRELSGIINFGGNPSDIDSAMTGEEIRAEDRWAYEPEVMGKIEDAERQARELSSESEEHDGRPQE